MSKMTREQIQTWNENARRLQAQQAGGTATAAPPAPVTQALPATTASARSTFEKLVALLVSSGFTRTKAVGEVVRSNPALTEKMNREATEIHFQKITGRQRQPRASLLPRNPRLAF
jgi:hypothetical protein